MNGFTKTAGNILACLLVLAIVFTTGLYFGAKKGRATADKLYENRLGFIVNVNRQLQAENQRLGELNQSITDRLAAVTSRLDRAKEIIDGFKGQVSDDGNTIQRIKDNLRQLELLIQAIYTDN